MFFIYTVRVLCIQCALADRVKGVSRQQIQCSFGDEQTSRKASKGTGSDVTRQRDVYITGKLRGCVCVSVVQGGTKVELKKRNKTRNVKSNF